MSYDTSYTSRTAGSHNQVKSVQSWKTAKASSSVEDNITNALEASKSNNDRTVNQRFSISDENTPTRTGNYSFKDVVDIVNPLHHVPVIGTVYRKLTGDTLHPMSRIIGGSIYGGPIGAVSSTLSSISEMRSGQDINDYALGLVTGKNSVNQAQYKMASHAYHPDQDERTAGLKFETRSNFETLSYSQKESYTVAPVTNMTLSAMPLTRDIQA